VLTDKERVSVRVWLYGCATADPWFEKRFDVLDIKEQLPTAALVKLLLDVPEGKRYMFALLSCLTTHLSLALSMENSSLLLSICQAVLRRGLSLAADQSGQGGIA
jgi:hypothetical protein